ncbi:hypothetical protein HMPREF1051_1743 [Neisseria sicca VK64]|uniref:Uncharacterized protein n=1 Tax=Neisseria sicca VK64 TaxID=1095748 RepID=I2NMI8_NEISI|nr:hypothetical protein HMPREF1051_1743 [Neisseria sicca VK64]
MWGASGIDYIADLPPNGKALFARMQCGAMFEVCFIVD